jgi:hypothetical protein
VFTPHPSMTTRTPCAVSAAPRIRCLHGYDDGRFDPAFPSSAPDKGGAGHPRMVRLRSQRQLHHVRWTTPHAPRPSPARPPYACIHTAAPAVSPPPYRRRIANIGCPQTCWTTRPIRKAIASASAGNRGVWVPIWQLGPRTLPLLMVVRLLRIDDVRPPAPRSTAVHECGFRMSSTASSSIGAPFRLTPAFDKQHINPAPNRQRLTEGFITTAASVVTRAGSARCCRPLSGSRRAAAAPGPHQPAATNATAVARPTPGLRP